MIPGVADVVSRGGFIKQYQVIPDLTQMKSRNLTMRQLFSALQKGNANAGGGYIERNGEAVLIRSEGLIGNLDDVRNVVVAATPKGAPVTVGALGVIPTAGRAVVHTERDDVVAGSPAIGVVVDARGRPLAIPDRDGERQTLLRRWAAAWP